jgi:hypothetical protein
MQIQEYNLHIQYISGVENLLADRISRNPAGLCEGDTKELFKPKKIVVSAINIGTDNFVERSHNELSTLQVRVKIIQGIIRTVEQKQKNASKNVMVQNDILYKKDSHRYPYWRLVLPTDLEIPVITYICTLLGHFATENAGFSLPALFMKSAWD